MKPHFETLQVHAGHAPDEQTRSRAVPIYQTTSYTFRDADHAARLFALEEAGNIYTRITNPTNAILEERMAALEGGVGALAVASGHSAELIALCALMKAGDNFVSSPYLYGGTHQLFSSTLANFGIEARFANDLDAKDFEMLIDQNTKAIYIETIGNSNLAVPDFEALAELAHSYKIPLIVDNTFGAGGYLCRPIDHGADIVVESATKWIGGHGNSMGGIIVDAGRFDWSGGKFPQIDGPSPGYHGVNMWERFGAQAFIMRCRAELLRDMGPALAPLNAFLLLQGIETLSLRAERESTNALALARYFAKHPHIERVNYPGLESNPYHSVAEKYLRNGFGAVLTIELKGGLERGKRFVDALQVASHLANVGDVRTLIVQPAATTHRQLSPQDLAAAGVAPGTLRISVGIEHIDDLIDDFEKAFDQ